MVTPSAKVNVLLELFNIPAVKVRLPFKLTALFKVTPVLLFTVKSMALLKLLVLNVCGLEPLKRINAVPTPPPLFVSVPADLLKFPFTSKVPVLVACPVTVTVLVPLCV